LINISVILGTYGMSVSNLIYNGDDATRLHTEYTDENIALLAPPEHNVTRRTHCNEIDDVQKSNTKLNPFY